MSHLLVSQLSHRAHLSKGKGTRKYKSPRHKGQGRSLGARLQERVLRANVGDGCSPATPALHRHEATHLLSGTSDSPSWACIRGHDVPLYPFQSAQAIRDGLWGVSLRSKIESGHQGQGRSLIAGLNTSISPLKVSFRVGPSNKGVPLRPQSLVLPADATLSGWRLAHTFLGTACGQ